MSVIKETVRPDASNAMPRARSISEVRVEGKKEREIEKKYASANGIVSRNSKAARHAVTRCNANLCFSFSRQYIFFYIEKHICFFFLFFGDIPDLFQRRTFLHRANFRCTILQETCYRNSRRKISQLFP